MTVILRLDRRAGDSKYGIADVHRSVFCKHVWNVFISSISLFSLLFIFSSVSSLIYTVLCELRLIIMLLLLLFFSCYNNSYYQLNVNTRRINSFCSSGWVLVNVLALVGDRPQNLKSLYQLPLNECTFPPLLFLHYRPFSYLRSSFWDGVKDDAWTGSVIMSTWDWLTQVW